MKRSRFVRLAPATVLLGVSALVGLLIANTVAFASGGAETRSPVRFVAAYDRARTGQDALPLELMTEWSAVLAQAPAENAPGAPIYDESRAALPGTSKIWLVPTSHGQLCRILDSPAAGGCINDANLIADGIDWGLVDSDGPGPSPIVIWGLVSSAISGVSAETPAGVYRAAIEDGAFVLTTATFPAALVTTTTDGHKERIEVPPPPR